MSKNDHIEKNDAVVITGRPDFSPDYAIGFAPGIIRLRDAPFYLGMSRNYFCDHVRKYLREIPMGENGIGFHRLELDLYIAYIKTTVGTSPAETPPWEADSDLIEIKRRVRWTIGKKPNAEDLDKTAQKVCQPSLNLTD